MADKKTEAPPIPESQIMSYARFIFPEIQKYYESEEGQREFARWKAEKAAKDGGE